MRSVRNLLVAVGLAAGLGLIPIAVMAAEPTTIVDSVFGVEVNFTHTSYPCPDYSSFAGSASGTAPGFWGATVGHQALQTGPGQTTSICGGMFALYTQLGDDPAVVTGKFNGGTITAGPARCSALLLIPCTSVTPSGTPCSQSFAVTGLLSGVGAGGSNAGTGTFSATLTHFGRWSSPNCAVVFPPLPIVSGTVTLIF
jgi:hypothetical protein